MVENGLETALLHFLVVHYFTIRFNFSLFRRLALGVVRPLAFTHRYTFFDSFLGAVFGIVKLLVIRLPTVIVFRLDLRRVVVQPFMKLLLEADGGALSAVMVLLELTVAWTWKCAIIEVASENGMVQGVMALVALV